ncbi:MAG TPA: DegT/DnrJ/EryC1/StrS family aminotransferase [Candidatus Omnitrophota bacterium]|nr:DegT/DnrJ/EryC1/StrS family aminotransferase [Candidatus Omnitrophota bacterium]
MKKPFKDSKFIIFGEPKIGKEERREIMQVLDSGWLSTGPRVEKFEKLFKDYTGARFACALNSCSAAMHLSLLACGIRKGDEVITTPFTYAATVNSILHVGAKPLFIDIDKHTFNIDPYLLEKKITSRSKAVIPVHFAGRPCDMERILKIGRKHGLRVIEDAAHAIGAQYHGKKIGNISDITCFSFYANKNITTGEGGMVTTNDPFIEKKIRTLSFNGIDKTPWNRYVKGDLSDCRISFAGYKYNMTDLQAALGIQQLKKINSFLRRRKEIWQSYNRAFKGLEFRTPVPEEPRTIHARHLYTLLLDNERSGVSRDEFRILMHKKNIGTGLHFIPLHLSAFYQRVSGCRRGDFPCSEYISQRIVSLPLSCALSDRDVSRIIVAVKEIFNKTIR